MNKFFHNSCILNAIPGFDRYLRKEECVVQNPVRSQAISFKYKRDQSQTDSSSLGVEKVFFQVVRNVIQAKNESSSANITKLIRLNYFPRSHAIALQKKISSWERRHPAGN